MFTYFQHYMHLPASGGGDREEDDTPSAALKLDPCEVAGTFKFNFHHRFPFTRHALSLVQSPGAFMALFDRQPVFDSRIMVSDEYQAHMEALARDHIISRIASDEARFLSRYFAVPKKRNGSEPTARAIFNGKRISRLMRPPPGVNLPHLPDLLKLCARILESHWTKKIGRTPLYLFCGDLRHFFHQIPIHPEIGKFFCLKCAGQTYRYNVLSMGWSYSPRIAQCLCWNLVLDNNIPAWDVSREELRRSEHPPTHAVSYRSSATSTAEPPVASGILFVWYDNIVYLETDQNIFNATVAAFDARSDVNACNVRWSARSQHVWNSRTATWMPHPRGTTSSSASPSFLGIQLRGPTPARPWLEWTTDVAFRDGCRNISGRLKSTETASRRLIARAIGKAVWDSYIRGASFSTIAHIITLARDNVARTRLQWDTQTNLSHESIAIIAQLLESIATPQWARRPEMAVENPLYVATDASGHTIAYVVFNRMVPFLLLAPKSSPTI
jgi:hypothetical protein